MARSATLEMAGQAPEEAPPGDGLNRWFDRCHATWKKQNRPLLIAAFALVWLPVPLFLWFNISAAHRHVAMAPLTVPLMLGLHSLYLTFCLALALLISVLACSRLVIPPEVQLTTAKQLAYAVLRRTVRRITYRWMLVLMLVPTVLFHALQVIPLLARANLLPHAPHWTDYVYYREFPVIAVAFWCWAEMVQFLALKFPCWRQSTRLLALLGAGLAYTSLRVNASIFSVYARPVAPWAYQTLEFLLFPILPIALATYMLLATHKPTPAMLERL